MIFLTNHANQVQVLSFSSTEEARAIGEHLRDMGDGLRFYARGPDDATPEDLMAALAEAQVTRDSFRPSTAA